MTGTHLRSMVIDHIRTLLQDQADESWRRNIQIECSRPGIEVRSFTGREIINDDHLMSEIDISINDMRGNKPGPTRDNDLHQSPPFRRFNDVLVSRPKAQGSIRPRDIPGTLCGLIRSGERLVAGFGQRSSAMDSHTAESQAVVEQFNDALN